MIRPFGAGIFKAWRVYRSDDSLLVGVSAARERSFNKTLALSIIGSMSPARLSLSTVASPHCRLLFHLAGEILTAKQPRLSGALRTRRLSSLKGGWKLSYCSPLPVEGEIFFLTSPFIEQAIALKFRLLSIQSIFLRLSLGVPPVSSFVTTADGLFFSYLLSRQTFDGDSYFGGKSVPRRNSCSRC